MNLTLIIIIAVCFFYIGYIIYRHLPDLKNLDINSLAELKKADTKAKILQAKLARHGLKFKNQWQKTLTPFGEKIKDRLEKAKNRVAALEAKYQKEKKSVIAEPLDLEKIFTEVENLISQEEFNLAEKKLIEVVAVDSKNIKAYELLSDLYFENKNYDQAEEILKYLIKLNTLGNKKGRSLNLKKEKFDELETDYLNSLGVSAKVAAYYGDLAQIYEIVGRQEKALDVYLKAISIEPNNPKYLDKLIELGIKLGDRSLAKKSLNRLKEINPDNAKLEEFKESIERM